MNVFKRLIFAWIVNFLGLWVAAELFTGISYNDKIHYLIIAALIFAAVNALIRPLLVILSLPAIVLSFGLFTLLVNTAMLYLTSLLYPKLHISSFLSALGAVVILWLINFLMTDLFYDNREQRAAKKKLQP